MNKCKFCGTTDVNKLRKNKVKGKLYVINACNICYCKQWRQRNPDYTHNKYINNLSINPDFNKEKYQKDLEHNPNHNKDSYWRRRALNPEYFNDPVYKQQKRDWKKTIKGKASCNENVMRRNAKKKGFEINMTPQEKEQMKWFYSAAKKVSLMKETQYDVDHIHPLAQGGNHSLENVQLLEHKLNTIKNDKLDTGITGCTYKALKNALSHIGEIKC